MDKIFEMDFNNCPYVDISYQEYDTGYKEYSCELHGFDCHGGDIDNGCPLSFKYKVDDNE